MKAHAIARIAMTTGLGSVLLGAVAVAVAQPADLTAHCGCLRETEARYDPHAVYASPNMPTTATEQSLNRWVYAERLYARCMAARGYQNVASPFPYGVSNYPGGREFDQPECRGLRATDPHGTRPGAD